MITWETLANRVGSDERHQEELERCIAVAAILVDGVAERAKVDRPVPELIRDECVLRTAESMFRASGNNDAGMLTGPDGTPMVAPNDPLRKSWPLLRKYVLPL